MRPLLPLPLALAGLAVAACSGDLFDEPDLLTPADVAGTYRVCELRFTPNAAALPEADVLAALMDAAATPAPALTLDGVAPAFELQFVRRRDGTVQRLTGEMEFGEGSVFLYPASHVPSLITLEALLPPGHVDLVFHSAARRLTAGDEVSGYWVRRQDYAAAAGISAEGLQERIFGHVTAAFSEGPCG